MAIRRMNEMWRRLALHSVLSVLLIQGCQGQTSTVAQQNQGTTMPSNTIIGNTLESTLGSTINSTTTISTTVNPTATGANTALPTTIRTSADNTSVNVNTNATAAVTNLTKNEDDNATEQSIPSVSPLGNQASPANMDLTEKPDNSTVSSDSNNTEREESTKVILQSTKPTAEDKDITEITTAKYDVTSDNMSVVKSINNMPESKSENNMTKSEVNSVETSSNKKEKSSTLLVVLLLCGLAVAAGVIGVYVKKNHCHTKGNSMKLAEESDHADEENQGNTLVSVAPLNPPEDQEKPNQNGESLEAVKIQNPPAATNGHSATKADTEF